MFFKRKRKKVEEFTLSHLRPILETLKYDLYASSHHQLPAYFWQSPYVLGLYGAWIGQFANLFCKGYASPEIKGFALIDVFSELSRMDGRLITREFTKLTKNPNPDFIKGVDNALLYNAYCSCLLKNEDQHEAIQQAKELAPKLLFDSDDESDERALIAGVILHNIVVGEVLHRLPQLKEENR